MHDLHHGRTLPHVRRRDFLGAHRPRVVYASTIADALRYGQFDDQPIYKDLAKPVDKRLTPAVQCLRDEMLGLWRRYEAKPDRVRY